MVLDIPEHRCSRGQVYLLMGIFIGLILLNAALVMNLAADNSIERADGLDTTSTNTDISSDIETQITQIVSRSNHDGNADISNEIDQLRSYNREGHKYSMTDVEISNHSTIHGTHLYEHDQDSLSPGRTIIQNTTDRGALTGGLYLNTSTEETSYIVTEDPVEDDALKITVGDIEMYVYIPPTDTENVEMLVVSGVGDNQTIRTERSSHTILDLGGGSFDRYDIQSYDQSNIGDIRVSNGNNGAGEIDVVVEGEDFTNADHNIANSDGGIFGVKYELSITTSDRKSTTKHLATHSRKMGGY